jgi:hypothetical protein
MIFYLIFCNIIFYTYSRRVLILLFTIPTLCTVAYIYAYVLWVTIILFFLICGVAANTTEAVSTLTLIFVLFLFLKTEYTILKRPIMRVKVLLMDQEALPDLTWGHVCIFSSPSSPSSPYFPFPTSSLPFSVKIHYWTNCTGSLAS